MLKDWMVSVIGGDRRMLEHMRQARSMGAVVKHYGSVPGSQEAANAPASSSLSEAIQDARLISCPIPGIATDNSLYAPFASEKLLLTTEVLAGAAPDALLFSGLVTPQLEEWAKGTSVTTIGYGHDDPLAILHAVPTAEGALKIAIENTDETLLGLDTLCIGLGRVGMSVVQAFDGLKAKVTLAARNPSQLARAWAMNTRTIHIDQLPDEVGRFSLIVNSTSSLVLTRDLLKRTRADVVIIDLCSPPGGVDFDAGKELKRNVIWARGQAGTAPKTAGYNEWQVMMRIVRERLAG